MLEQKDRILDLAGDALGLELLLKLVRFGVVDSSEAAEEHVASGGS